MNEIEVGTTAYVDGEPVIVVEPPSRTADDHAVVRVLRLDREAPHD